ncbi:L,D-transpeptidase family protein [Secundilactobacillus folii]|uniref:L,D-transpeptidase family protein n=1 Tax=Secundilactobacillus folii TaxID=2678357 RepID=A0A7X2XTX7_9LACO|nr:L,D-transpeptidase family protein [Secundilactobacillus folii]MTV81536.1 L,D-transpeptidase family protein [Secundilactobacillus folii]
MKHRTNRQLKGLRWLIAALTFLVVLGIGGMGYASYYSQRFKPAQINGVKVTNLTAAQATKKLNQADSQTKRKTLTVTQSRVTVSQTTVEKALRKRNEGSSPLKTVQLTVKAPVSKVQLQARKTTLLSQFKQQIETINATRTKPIAAKVTLKNGQTTVTAGRNGNALDEAKMVASYKKQISSAAVIRVKDSQSQVGSTSSSNMKATKVKMQQLLNRMVSIKLPNRTITLKARDYLKNGYMTTAGQTYFDPTTVQQLVAKLAKEYDTQGKSMRFTTHSGSKITVPAGGTYGWSISQAKLTARILQGFEGSATQAINLKNDVAGTGYGSTNGIGKTYIEVDLKNLREYAYVNGKLKFSTAVMSGTITGGNKTPQGVYYILYKQRNTTLTGANDNGSTYHSKVKYWMPITNDGVGLHDSPWQPSYVYGNPSYRSTYHSHGCINNPPSKIGSLYKISYAGEPVVIYD